MPPYVGMARKQNGGYHGSISVQTPIFHLVVNSTRLKTEEHYPLNNGHIQHSPISQTCIFLDLISPNNNNLTSIDLSSLREIKGGGFYLSNNLQLCLIGNFSSIMTNTSAPVCVTTQARRDPQQCGETLTI